MSTASGGVGDGSTHTRDGSAVGSSGGTVAVAAAAGAGGGGDAGARPPPSPDDDLFKSAAAEVLPPHLALPTPAPRLPRLLAGAADALVASSLGGLVGFAVAAGAPGAPELSAAAASMAALLAWVVRDAVIDDGNRSLGKKLAGLEIVLWDGALPTRAACLGRNVYWLAFATITLHPVCDQLTRMMAVADLASFALTADMRKLGDWGAGTRVVLERSDRPAREAAFADRAELVAVERELQRRE